MRTVDFVPKAFDEYHNWIQTDRKTALKIGNLIKDILRTPFEGIGKPEALKYDFKGYWSRRIDNENRLVYKVTEDSIVIFFKQITLSITYRP